MNILLQVRTDWTFIFACKIACFECLHFIDVITACLETTLRMAKFGYWNVQGVRVYHSFLYILFFFASLVNHVVLLSTMQELKLKIKFGKRQKETAQF